MNPESGVVTVRATSRQHEKVQEFIDRVITSSRRQVLIEARIVEASDTFGKSLGAKLGFADLRGLRGGTPGWSVGGDNRVSVGGNAYELQVEPM